MAHSLSSVDQGDDVDGVRGRDAALSSPNDIKFVLNSHGPTFENYSLICIKSILRICPDPKISVYRPLNLPPLSERALRFYRKYGVEVVEFRNEFLPDQVVNLSDVPARHLTLNKIYCLSHMHQDERRLFLDADTLVIKDPRPYLHSLGVGIAVPPVDTPDAFGGDWRELYSGVGVRLPDEKIRVWERYSYGSEPESAMVEIVPYFCSGVIFVSGTSKLSSKWAEMCQTLERKLELIPRTYFLDQIALSVAVAATGEERSVLSRGFNCHFETLKRVDDLHIFHYLNFDALAAGVARDSRVRLACREVIQKLNREDGLDLRLQTLTEWPRLYRRVRSIVLRRVRSLLGLTQKVAKERS